MNLHLGIGQGGKRQGAARSPLTPRAGLRPLLAPLPLAKRAGLALWPVALLLGGVILSPGISSLAAPGDAIDAGEERFSGVLVPAQTVLLKSRHDEQIAEVAVEVGSAVVGDGLLLRFINEQERVEVKQAEAFLKQTEANCERMRSLHKEDSISDSILEDAELDLRLAETDLDLARIRLDELSIRAPFSGVVAERFVDPGASVESGDPLLRLTALTPLHVQVLLPERMLSVLRDPAELEVTLSATGETLTVPYEPGPLVVDPGSGTFLLQVEVENADHQLVPGVSCQVAIRSNPQPVTHASN